MKRIALILLIFSVLFSLNPDVMGQTRIYEGPDDGAGDPHLEREGFMTGNRVQLLFKNNTELGDYPRKDAARWPRGTKSNVMHDGIGVLVGAAVYLTNSTEVVTDTNRINDLAAKGLIDTLYFCQTNYREEMDRDDTGQIEWGFHPAPGYMNNSSETPALSNDPNSWPSAGWPYRGREVHWPGEWDGRFGRGQIRADLEAYFAANDAQDIEYLGEDDVLKYYPRPGINIGDIDGGVTVQKGQPWGGLGIRIQQRGFQWNNPMAQDAVFWEYTIANISIHDLPHAAFGYWFDNDIGGENAGEDAAFVKLINLSYSWDVDGKGEDSYDTGTMGFAFLESPGNSGDGKDNDDDGLIDEARNNDAGSKIGALDGIQSLSKFLYFYGLREDQLHEHWSGDEDQDWNDGEDTNGNDIYDASEYAGDDVGLDGVAPGEENYDGPDEGECNHMPDLDQVKAEPNFGWTDVSETDMLGLTTLLYYDAVPHTAPYYGWFRHDESVWKRMILVDSLEVGATDISNLFQLFSTSVFPLPAGETQFISLSQLHSYDELTGLNSAEHAAPALVTLKKTVQVIYEKDYRFAQPPKMPTLTAIPGDGFVQLIWDNRADTKTREPFLNNINDFEGYKIYRSTDKDMNDPMIITDGFGTKTFNRPIFQCDLKNGKEGFTEYGLLNGMGYYLGSDKGLAYSFKDENVQNGRTYYYAIVAYDYGIHPDSLKGTSVISSDKGYGIAPSENNVVIRKDEFEIVEFIGPNVKIVTPGTDAAGIETESEATVDISKTLGTGQIVPVIVAPNSLKEGATYKVKFDVLRKDSLQRYHFGHGVQFTSNGISVWEVVNDTTDVLILHDGVMENNLDQLVPKNLNTVLERSDNDTPDNLDDDFYHVATSDFRTTEIFDGIQLSVKMDVTFAEYDAANSGWMPGSSPMNVTVTPDVELGNVYPWDYNIIFSDDPAFYTGQLSRFGIIEDINGGRVDREFLIYQQPVNFRVELTNFKDADGNPFLMDMVIHDINGNGTFDLLEDHILVGEYMLENKRWGGTVMVIHFNNLLDESELPKPNDVYAVRFKRPFYTGDEATFVVNSNQVVTKEKVKSDMENIKVVPNPYVASNVMEPSVINKDLNQSRRLMFTNLPEKCTVKIFTVSGILIRELHAPEDGLVYYPTVNEQTNEKSNLGQTTKGILHWNMLTKEGLEIAAGMYLYHVEDDATGEEKTGKFGVIK